MATKKTAAAKTEAAQGIAGGAHKIAFAELKHWATGTMNQTGEPVLIIQTAQGAHFGLRLTPKHAADISKALSDLVNQKTPKKSN